MAPKRHPSATEPDPFLLEKDTLRHHAAHGRPEADASPRIDDPLPGHPAGHVPERPAHHPRTARKAEPTRDLPVGRDPPAWDEADETPDRPLEIDHGRPPPNCSS